MESQIRALERSPLYSEELGIDLARANDHVYFQWFLASLLFGARIGQSIARRTYRGFAAHGLLEPGKILAAGWDYLVNPIMREGGYVRYDGRKSEQILRDCRTLLADYGGSLVRLHELAANAHDLERRLEAFYGVGPVTVNIFLRELRPWWPKADPEPLAIVLNKAGKVGIDLARRNRKTVTFCRLEAGLMRLRRKRDPGRSNAE